MQQSKADRELKYEQIQESYSWSADERLWTSQQRFTGTLGRMISGSPSLGDFYFLCLLLKHKSGALSFEDLRTINSNL
jgi:hypothetical protein